MPVLICMAIYLALRRPTGMYISVYNQETNCSREVIVTHLNITEKYCEKPDYLSCRILKYLTDREIKVVSYNVVVTYVTTS